VNITVAALPTSGIVARMRPTVMSQNVNQASARPTSGIWKARAVMNRRNPQMKNVVHTRTFRTPWIVRLW
jgi:hypothetical protein